MNFYNISDYLKEYLETIHKFKLNDNLTLDNIIFKNDNFGSMEQNVYTKEEKDKIINELSKKDYIKEQFLLIPYITGYSELFLLLYKNGPENYMNKYIPIDKQNDEYLNSLKKLYDYKEFIRIMFNLLNPSNKTTYKYFYTDHKFSNEYKFIFNYIIEEFLKFHNISNLLDDTDKNILIKNMSFIEINSILNIINQDKNKNLLNKILTEFTNLK